MFLLLLIAPLLFYLLLTLEITMNNPGVQIETRPSDIPLDSTFPDTFSELQHNSLDDEPSLLDHQDPLAPPHHVVVNLSNTTRNCTTGNLFPFPEDIVTATHNPHAIP
jgi:hypothetical protein